MSDLNELLRDFNASEARTRTRHKRIVRSTIGVAIAVAAIAGIALASSAMASVADYTERYAEHQQAILDVENEQNSAPSSPLPTARAPQTSESPVPVYNADTDLATIPRMPADSPTSEKENGEIWLLQQQITAICMRDKGYDYIFTPYWLYPPGYVPRGTENWDGDRRSPKGIALMGDPANDDVYGWDWTTAGCSGYAVHETGMDGVN